MSAAATKPPGTLLEALLASLDATLRSPDGVVDPVAILWTDIDGSWRPLLAGLRTAIPQFYSLGDYSPETRTGPAVWLKCVVDRSLPDVSPPAGVVPILYLPDVDRQQLRASGDCPAHLQPLVELQYRGVVWHQRNGRDWTVDAFLTSEHGLGLDVASDSATRAAIVRALPLLAAEPLGMLQGRRLESDDFDRLTIGDPMRDLLSWMSDPDGFRARNDASRWETFRTVCAREFDLDPENDGQQKAGDALLNGGGKWDVVWQRFRDAPKVYRGIATLLRGPAPSLLVDSSRRPNLNAEKEDVLRRDLEGITEMPHHDACGRVIAMEKDHAERRGWVWAELGESPLAIALEPLARLANLARTPLGGTTLEAAIANYVAEGWRCDRAALDAMTQIASPAENGLISRVVCALYEPWLDKSARHFQSLAGDSGVALRAISAGVAAENDTCVLFADGLRFDVAGMLQELLDARGVRTKLSHRVTALPTVTATAKPWASPVHQAITGDSTAENFTPRISASGQEVTAQRLRDELANAGTAVVSAEDLRPQNRGDKGGWSEVGQLDKLGHSLGIKLARHVQTEIEVIAERVLDLLEAGWTRVRVVTDHGWLLLPGGLPKVDLPHYLVQSRWARCATVKGESAVSMPTFAWHWNRDVRIASPPGIGAFGTGVEYTHGGVSAQECVVPELVVERGADRLKAEIKSISWRGMRCRVAVDTNAPGARVDIRTNWKQPTTSIVAGVKEVSAGGEASLAVEDDSKEGSAAMVVVLDQSGQTLDYKPTTVGEGT